ncbi:MAG TPA: sortase [Herpetosiphon sp.]|uniref:Peptidase C60 sortase A and B n=1 Tax=Herpetosiphon aurantiacus (strain ATCC 23779 / DSM 785 / 114-95) TaxID=316274 RepID=A9B819_HERA2|nr:sortase [Herpetosiphon sp.]ABX05952.1 peptidase C60 sortase A and B [Herpetosiphon aurantiacus DSM 785]HBW50565.1 sortase [Herpetosiphon sp.]
MMKTTQPAHPIAWTLGNLLLFCGMYLLLYVGGMYADDFYNRLAARGDSTLPIAAPIIATPEPAITTFQAPTLNQQTASDQPPTLVTSDHSTISRIQIPRIEVDQKVIEVGWELQDDVATWQVAKYAVGHHQGSANPGEPSNIVLAGHVGGSAPVFDRLIETQPGDQIVLYSNGQQYLYVVQSNERVQEVGVSEEQRLTNAAYMNPTSTETITLITCWPPAGPNAFDQRIIVRAVPYTIATEQPAGSNWQMR